jgi:hypothetical protein
MRAQQNVASEAADTLAKRLLTLMHSPWSVGIHVAMNALLATTICHIIPRLKLIPEYYRIGR